MHQNVAAIAERIEVRAGRSPLLSRLYHEVGLAAVAAEFKLPVEPFEPELAEAIERGARYLAPPKLPLAS
jgi:hypothetical protein